MVAGQNFSSIREAITSDIDPIMSIAAEGFRRSPRWRKGGSFARQWVEVALASPFAEFWVFEHEGAVVAFVVLVIDEVGWATERTARCGQSLDYLRAMATQPGMLFPELKRRRMLRVAIRDSETPSIHVDAGDRTWIELISVSGGVRRMGIAQQLEDWCETRTLAQGRTRIDLNVDPANQRMRAWCENAGYVLASYTHAGCLYSKQGLTPIS